MAAKKCSKCGEEKPLEQFYKFKLGRLGRQSECKICSDARRRAFAKTRPEEERRSRQEWRARNLAKALASAAKYRNKPEAKEWMKKYSAEWYEANKGRLKAIRREWYEKNKDAHNERSRSYYRANPALWNAYNKKWAQEHREKCRVYTSVSGGKRRAAKNNSPSNFSAADIQYIYAMQRGCCASCRVRLGSKFHRDHIVPLAKGGTNEKHNIQLLCKSCNCRKHAKDPIEFMQSRGFLL